MGFLTIAFDPSFTGESGDEPRFMASPDINTEDFQAAIDFLAKMVMLMPKEWAFVESVDGVEWL